MGAHVPFTVGSLRTGGATHLFRRWDESLVRLCWRGRWKDANTVWHYVQELQAAEIAAQSTAAVAERVQMLASLLPELVAEWIELQEG